jgi:hypothetical protein
MILVPLPRWSVRPEAPFFRRHKRAVDETFPQIQTTALLEILCDGQEHFLHHSRTHPVLEAAMDGLIFAVALGQILPRSTRAQDPEDAVEDGAPIAPRPPASIATHGIFGQDGADDFPLLFCQVHPPSSKQIRAKYKTYL